MTRTVAIHQPNFFPWLGFFDKIARSDVFVVLDDVQLPRSGAGSWVNRVKLAVGGADRWATAPIRRESGLQSIDAVQFDESQPWRRKLLATVQAAYGKAPGYAEAGSLVEELIANPESNLARYNLHAIKSIASRLGLDTDAIQPASQFGACSSSNDLLIELTKAVGGDAYLCGGGADGYQDDELFGAAQVSLRYQQFAHPSYQQHGTVDFIPGLSIIDALLNLGMDGTRRLIGTCAQ